MSLLAPFSAALVGATVGLALDHRRLARRVGAVALAGGAVTEIVVVHASATDLDWMTPVLIGERWPWPRSSRCCLSPPRRGRWTRWGTPRAGRSRPAVQRRLGWPAAAAAPLEPAAAREERRSPLAAHSRRTPPQPARLASGARWGGGTFGASSPSLDAAMSYVRGHDGGTLIVSSQSSAAAAILASGAHAAGIGGFSGNETQVSTAWFAREVAAGKIRYVLADSTGGAGISDGRIGATEIMALVKRVGSKVSSVSGLYDLHGNASEIAAAAG